MKKLCVFFASLLLFASCEKENEPEIEIPRYKMKYSFYISETPPAFTVRLYTATGFPIENETVLCGNLKSNNEYYRNTENWLRYSDSLIIEPHITFPEKLVYTGCSYGYLVDIMTYDEINYYQTKYFIQGTIQSSKDADIKFVWPQDTARFEKIEYYTWPRVYELEGAASSLHSATIASSHRLLNAKKTENRELPIYASERQRILQMITDDNLFNVDTANKLD
jgi:hypothetical protein